jgi:hypothetical protein
MSPTSLALTTNPSFNNNHKSLQSPPIANAGPNKVVTAGSTVILNGSSSRAPNGIILSYSWKQIPTDIQTTLSGVNTPVWEFIAPNVTADTLLRFQLNITDNLGQVGTAFVNVLDKPASSTAIISPPIEKLQSTATQLLANVKKGNNSNVTNTTLSSSLSSAQTRLHMIKITSPTKGQQIPVHSGLKVSGISVANSTSGFCYVSVIVNGIKPYRMTVATGKGGANDYSTWNYRLTPTYAVIKEGQNKITAKFSCSNNPSLISYDSVNVIGVSNNNHTTVIAPRPQPVLIPNSNSKLLLISLDVAKNSVNAGDEETIKIKVLNASNPNITIAGASVIGIVTDSTIATTTNFNGVTDNSGTFTHTWKISKDTRPGIFTVSVLASATGYKSQLIPTKLTFNVSPAVAHEMVPQRKTFNCRVFILPPGPCA